MVVPFPVHLVSLGIDTGVTSAGGSFPCVDPAYTLPLGLMRGMAWG